MSKAEIKHAQIRITGKASSEDGVVGSRDLTIRMNGEILRTVQRLEFFATVEGPVLVKMELLVGEIEIDLDNVQAVVSKNSPSKSNISRAESLKRRLTGKHG